MRRIAWVAAGVLMLVAPPTLGAQQAPEISLGAAPRGRPAVIEAASTVAGPAQTSAPLTVNTADRAAVAALYNDVLLPALAVPLQWSGNVFSCDPGATSFQYDEATIAPVNYYRAMAGLPAEITRNPVMDARAQAAALMINAAEELNHLPYIDAPCYTVDGAMGSNNSNLALAVAGAEAVTYYIQDFGRANTDVGHRRWILYPPQQQMGTGSTFRQITSGRSLSSNALWVLGDFGRFGPRPVSPAFVAWPAPGYVPYKVVYPRWSFAVNTSERVSLASATVTMTSEFGGSISLTVLPQSPGFADDTIVWEPVLSFFAGMGDRTYNVRIDNVIVGGAAKSYSYAVKVFDPSDPALIDLDHDDMPDAWERMFGLNAQSNTGDDGADGDPDHDGLTNQQERLAGTHPRGFVTRYLAEGANNGFFATSIALLNPSPTAAVRALVRVQPQGQAERSRLFVLPPHARTTVTSTDLALLTGAPFSTVIEADGQVVVDRTMTWDRSGYGAHAEEAVEAPSTTWYLAEGSTAGDFSLFYLLQNPSATAATATVRYLRPSPAPPLERVYQLAPRSRVTIPVDTVAPELEATDVSGVITSTLPIVVERAMYLDRPGEPFSAGHESAGVTAPADTWFLAEGATGSFFELFVLIANPNPTASSVTIDYLLEDGTTLSKDYTVGPNSRYTIWVDEESFAGGAKLLASQALSMRVHSTNGVPIIVERSMWWPEGAWYEAHNSAGATSTGTRWALAGGQTGRIGLGAPWDTYVLVANTSAFAGQAELTIYLENGDTDTKSVALPAQSRTTIAMHDLFPSRTDVRYGVVVRSVGSATPPQIVVERAMYSSVNGVPWSAGTNVLATRLDP